MSNLLSPWAFLMLCIISRSENIMSDPVLGKMGCDIKFLMSLIKVDMNGILGPSGVRVKRENGDGSALK